MTCTVAAIISMLGHMPPRGTEIVIPRSMVGQYTYTQRIKAIACAARHGIKWRIDERS